MRTFYLLTVIKILFIVRRWIKCLLVREFDTCEAIILWDAMFAYDIQYVIEKNNFIPEIIFLDYICVGMIHRLRNESIFYINKNSP
jgi:hypothetical protein